ncbi:MAG: 1-deoxy-D-xylulose-5-phosphate synthase, partial [Flavobacteriales bacterium]|nr:1-deoxy-D-xylulose-5-phosphate synthase [Flavobacteriales bacterium]
RGKGVMPEWRKPMKEIEIGKGRLVSQGKDLAILSIGHVGNYAVQAKTALKVDGLNPSIYDMRFVKPLDEELLHEIFQNHDSVVTVEDGCLMGGFGSAILEFMADHDYSVKVVRLGIPDRVVEHGEQPELHAECGYDQKAIVAAVRKLAPVNAPA